MNTQQVATAIQALVNAHGCVRVSELPVLIELEGQHRPQPMHVRDALTLGCNTQQFRLDADMVRHNASRPTA